jgi:hypothetical protein
MVAVKPLASIADKYVRRASAAQSDYQAGVQGASPATWETNTAAGADNYSAGVSQAVAEGRFAAGVQGKGAKWQRKATTVGPQRYQTGVAAAAPDYTQGMQPYFNVLQSLTLGPRGPRGDPRNYQRSQQVGQALNQARRQAG